MNYNSLVVFLLGLQCFMVSRAMRFYIAPGSGNCTVVQTPCHTLPQLISEHILFEVPYKAEVELVFLPGTHEMPGDQLFTASYLNELEFRPLYRWQEVGAVIIECEYQLDHYTINFIDIVQFSIYSTYFKFCSFSFSRYNYNKLCLHLLSK